MTMSVLAAAAGAEVLGAEVAAVVVAVLLPQPVKPMQRTIIRRIEKYLVHFFIDDMVPFQFVLSYRISTNQ